jgi:dTDP-glucose pyrophosphorylase
MSTRGANPAEPSAYQGVILAAGKGTRIQPFSEQLPKPMLPVLDRPLLVWQIEAMRDLGIRDIVIVIGHLGHHVVQSLGDGSAFGVRLSYVEQEHVLGIAHAVAQLERHIDRPFLLFLGDIFFETENLGSMLDMFAREDVHGVLAVKEEPSLEAIKRNFTVQTNAAGFVTHVIEKPRKPQTTVKGCGLYLFDPDVFDAIRRTPRTALRDEYELTHSIQIFIDAGYGVLPAPVVQRDLNLSQPSDLLDINLHVMGERGEDLFLGEGAVIEDGADVDRCVVLRGARVAPGVKLRECLVFPGDRVTRGDHERTVFAGGREISGL